MRPHGDRCIESPVPIKWEISIRSPPKGRTPSESALPTLRYCCGHGLHFAPDLFDQICGVSEIAFRLDVEPEPWRLTEVTSDSQG